jgi:hypothetical protein
MASAIIYGSRSQSGTQPAQRRISEKAAQTWLMGVPVNVDSTGNLIEWDGTTVAAAIAGVSAEQARNRTTAGTPQVIPATNFVPANQPNAVNITLPPFDDGKLNIYISNQDTIFFGQVGPSQLASAVVVGKAYGMTKDSDNHWYVDTTKVTSGTNTVVIVVGIDDYDPRGVYFKFQAAAIEVV